MNSDLNLFQEIGPNYLGGQMDLESRTAIHLSHRFGAIFVSALIIFLSWTLYKEGYRKITFLLLILSSFYFYWGISSGSIPGTKVMPAFCFQSWG